MSQSLPRAMALVAGMALFSTANSADAQIWYPTYAAPQPICQCITPPQYMSVPVTEYQEVRHVVQRPVVETKYVDQKVTVYKPVVENKTVDIPTVSYHDTTEYQTVQSNYGHWSTQYQYRPHMSPYQYDPHPDLLGLLNRVGYRIRTAFTPPVIARPVYTPSTLTQTVPVTRRVAVHGTRKATYQVTRMVPHTESRRVAVNTVRMVSQEVITRRPVTVMRSIPFGGTTVSYGPFFGATTTVLVPQPDAVSTARRPARPRRGNERTAEEPNEYEGRKRRNPPRGETDNGASGASHLGTGNIEETHPITTADNRLDGYRSIASSRSPSIVRVGRWIATRPAIVQGPAFPTTTVAATD